MGETRSHFAKKNQQAGSSEDIIYVSVQYDGKIINTNPSTSGNLTHPLWDHSVSFLIRDCEEPVVFKIMQQNFDQHEIIAEAQVPIYELCNLKTTVRNLFPLIRKRQPGGEIYLEGKYSADPMFDDKFSNG